MECRSDGPLGWLFRRKRKARMDFYAVFPINRGTQQSVKNALSDARARDGSGNEEES